MVVLDALILSGAFVAPEVFKSGLSGNTFILQIATTFSSLYFTISNLLMESEAFKMDSLEYLLTCLKAK